MKPTKDDCDNVELMHNRGLYSTIRSLHEENKATLQMLCGELASTSTKVLRRMQPDNDEVPDSVDDLLTAARNTITMMEQCVKEIESLAEQRAKLKPLAWPRK